MDLVSVVVPVFNVEKYLNRCLESIVNQTYQNLEILLINDGSTDKSEIICKEWARKDKRILFFSKSNEGLGPTRNFGIERANGKYIAFIDSDDWWELNAVELLIANAQFYDSDMVYMNFFWEELKEGFYERREYCQQCLFEGASDSTEHPDLIFSKDARTWSKFYKKSLFIENDIKFPAHPFEDFPINPILVLKAKKISQVHMPLYHYHMNRKGNITGQGISYKYITHGLEELENNLRDIGCYEDLESQFKTYSIQLVREFVNGGVEEEVSESMLRFLNEKYPEDMTIYKKRICFMGSYAGVLFLTRNLFHNQILTKDVSDIPQKGKLEIECSNATESEISDCDYFMIDILDVEYADRQLKLIESVVNEEKNKDKKIILLGLLWADKYGTTCNKTQDFENKDEIKNINLKIINKLQDISKQFGKRCIVANLGEEYRYTYVNTSYGCVGKYYNNNYYKNGFQQIKAIMGA